VDNYREDPNSLNATTPSAVLVFKVITFTPLLLVSKEFNTQVQQVLRILRPIWHNIIESGIYQHRIVSPCPAFLDICSRSRFVFDYSSADALWFLYNIPDCMKPCIRHIVIARKCLVGRRSTCLDIWDQYAGINHCEFTHALRRRCPSLDTVALEVPSVISGGQYTVQSATSCLLQLLLEKVINSVHFVQRAHSAENPHDQVIFEKLRQLSDPTNTTPTPQSNEFCTTDVFPRIFDILEESGDTLKGWNDLGFERALRVTRFADTQLGTPYFLQNYQKI
jgi:hypothetical protein